MKKSAIIVSAFCLFSLASAQTIDVSMPKAKIEHFDISVNAGSMGIAAEANAILNEWVGIRAGVSYMPTVNATIGFGVQVGTEEEKKYDANGNRIETKFEKMAGLLESIYGFKVDDRVDMACRANWFNAKILFDLTPYDNTDWHFTAGFYVGTRKIGHAINTTEDMATTMAVTIYNTMYDKIEKYEPIISIPGYPNVFLPAAFEDKIYEYGRMGMHVGDFKEMGEDGKPVPYFMVPDDKSTVRATAKVNAFKPYLGFGWYHQMKSYPVWSYGFDAGIIFWGGVPNVYTHDGTSLTKDVNNLKGKVGDIISLVNKFPVYPLLEVKVARRIF